VAATTQPSQRGLRVIGALKVLTAALLAAAGFGIFHLLGRDPGHYLTWFASHLHLDPENRLLHWLIMLVAQVDEAKLKAIGVGTFFYATLEAVEGVGLWMRKGWAEYLTVIATASLLPLEVYEIARKTNMLRIGVFVANVLILAYIIGKLVEEQRARRGSEASRRQH
jgi:uncharacterized membrane protein (DUF2068 family)